MKKDVSNKKTSSINVVQHFESILSNQYQIFLIQKTEKLASALYVITNFLPPTEPIRERLRVCALDLMAYSAKPASLDQRDIESFSSRCIEIASMLQTAQSGGLVSFMNAKLMCDEYAQLASFVREQHENITGRSRTGTQALRDSEALELLGDIRRDSPLEMSLIKRTSFVSPKKRQNERRSLILSLFDKKSSISIKDAVSTVVGYSEKTIQRELLALVAEGVLQKVGERRWTQYRIAPKPA